MASITRCWKSFLLLEPLIQSALKRVRQHSAALVAVLCIGLSGVVQADTSVELQALKLERQESALYMSGEWRFDMPSALEEALLKGITLYFVTEVEITQERWYVYNQRIANAERHVRVFYQPLTRR